MNRILLLIENQRNRRLLEGWLEKTYEIAPANPDHPLEERFDLAITDGFTLKRLRSKVRARRKAEEPVLLPFLLLTLRRKGTIPLQYLGQLVDDVIVRPLDKIELRARVANLLRLRKLSLELKKEHDLVVRLSVTDDVSGFHNTRYLHRYLDRALASPRAREKQVSLVFFDLDNFKRVVDTHGHMLGAKVLREVAQAVHHVIDEDDRIVRYGGDEYIVILPGQGKGEAIAKVERMMDSITSTLFLQKENLNVQVTASFGVATFPQDAKDKRELLAEADQCLFASKRTGKNRICFAGTPDLGVPEMIAGAESTVELETSPVRLAS